MGLDTDGALLPTDNGDCGEHLDSRLLFSSIAYYTELFQRLSFFLHLLY